MPAEPRAGWDWRSQRLAQRGRVPFSREGGRVKVRAFTLIEILLAVALLGLLSAAMVSVAGHLTDSRPRSPEDVFWEAARTARRTALKTGMDVRLTYDSKDKVFVIAGREGAQNFPVPENRDLTIDLLHAQASGGSILIGGQLVDTRTLTSVSFYADGTCTPFRVQFRATGPARIVTIDPWTCAPILPEPKTT